MPCSIYSHRQYIFVIPSSGMFVCKGQDWFRHCLLFSMSKQMLRPIKLWLGLWCSCCSFRKMPSENMLPILPSQSFLWVFEMLLFPVCVALAVYFSGFDAAVSGEAAHNYGRLFEIWSSQGILAGFTWLHQFFGENTSCSWQSNPSCNKTCC